MRLRVKADVCVGHGMCQMACPELFRLSDEDGHAVILSEDVPAELEAAVSRAVSGCPEGAIETY